VAADEINFRLFFPSYLICNASILYVWTFIISALNAIATLLYKINTLSVEFLSVFLLWFGDYYEFLCSLESDRFLKFFWVECCIFSRYFSSVWSIFIENILTDIKNLNCTSNYNKLTSPYKVHFPFLCNFCFHYYSTENSSIYKLNLLICI
jgi:hypothetical protein